MCKKITVIKNTKVLRLPKRNVSQYISTELADKLERVASDNSIGKNVLCEYALRKIFGMDTKLTEVKEVLVK